MGLTDPFVLEKAVAFLIFNRPDTTARVFEAIRRARPPKLLVVADGPRPERPGDKENCRRARDILKGVDWPCQVLTNFSDVNLGCKKRISSGLDWVFKEVEEAIVLEDDCLPAPDFFRYASELLDYYRQDARVMMIAGTNFQPGPRSQDSYYFSRYTQVWGWATWARAWKLYDVGMKDWPGLAGRGLLNAIFPESRAARGHWRWLMQATFGGGVDTWDYQWNYCCWKHGGLCAIPEANLVSNIGVGAAATHAVFHSPFTERALGRLDFPLRHPAGAQRNLEADRYSEILQHSGYREPGLKKKAGYWLRRLRWLLRG